MVNGRPRPPRRVADAATWAHSAHANARTQKMGNGFPFKKGGERKAAGREGERLLHRFGHKGHRLYISRHERVAFAGISYRLVRFVLRTRRSVSLLHLLSQSNFIYNSKHLVTKQLETMRQCQKLTKIMPPHVCNTKKRRRNFCCNI